MDTINYNEFKKQFSSYTPCERGLFGFHLATSTLLLIIGISEDHLSFDCLIRQEENKEVSFCNVTYSQAELLLTDFTLEAFISKQKESTGVQLELF